jgi:hypothetical protein
MSGIIRISLPSRAALRGFGERLDWQCQLSQPKVLSHLK